MRVKVGTKDNKIEYYGVSSNIRPGVYISREKAKQAPGLLELKKFGSYDEAYAFAWGRIPNVYADGSFNEKYQVYGYGYVIEYKDINHLEEYYGYGNEDSYMRYRNVAGELIASLNAMFKAIENGVKEIKLFYDFQGTHQFATTQGSIKNHLGQTYRRTYDELVKPHLKVHFIKYTKSEQNKHFQRAHSLSRKGVKEFKEKEDYRIVVKEDLETHKLRVFNNCSEMAKRGKHEEVKVSFDLDSIRKIRKLKGANDRVLVDIQMEYNTGFKNREKVEHILDYPVDSPYILMISNAIVALGTKQALQGLAKDFESIYNKETISVVQSNEDLAFNHSNSLIKKYRGKWIEITPGMKRRMKRLGKELEVEELFTELA